MQKFLIVRFCMFAYIMQIKKNIVAQHVRLSLCPHISSPILKPSFTRFERDDSLGPGDTALLIPFQNNSLLPNYK